jgi:Ran GTPase-activating protein (RanGAP) involved in mRNA processing and transport
MAVANDTVPNGAMLTDEIPDELMLEIFKYFGNHNKICEMLEDVSKRFRRLVDDPVLVRDLCKRGKCFHADDIENCIDINPGRVHMLELFDCEDLDTSIIKFIFRNNPNIHYLSLCRSELECESMIGLADALTENSTLKRLDLQENYISNEGVGYLVNVLKRNTSIKMIDLSRNLINQAALNLLVNIFDTNFTIETLYLDYNRDLEDGNYGIQALANALERNISLDSINLSDCLIGDAARSIFEKLQFNTVVTEIDLYHNVITGDSMRDLSNTLGCNTTITSINLNCNPIDSNGIRQLVNALTENTTVKILDIGTNPNYPEKNTYIADLIRTNSTIHTLNIEEIELRDDGIISISNAIRGNTTLRKLNISNNNITNVGIQHFINVLRDNTTICELDIDQDCNEDDIKFDDIYNDQLNDIIKRNISRRS